MSANEKKTPKAKTSPRVVPAPHSDRPRSPQSTKTTKSSATKNVVTKQRSAKRVATSSFEPDPVTKPSATKAFASVAKPQRKKPSKTKAVVLLDEVATKPKRVIANKAEAYAVPGGVFTAEAVMLAKLEDEDMEGWLKPPAVNSAHTYGVTITDDIMLEMCKLIANGWTLNRVLKLRGTPSLWSFWDSINKNPAHSAQYNKAVLLRVESWGDEIVEMADASLTAKSREEVSARQLMVQARQWMASRLLPRKYGDKMTVAGDPDNPLVAKLVAGAEELRAKLRGGSLDVVDVEVRDVSEG